MKRYRRATAAQLAGAATMDTAPKGPVLRLLVPKEGDGAALVVEGFYRDDVGGEGWVMASDHDAFLFEPTGWLS